MKLLPWCKANAMPVIAVLAAAVTAVFVPPDAAYLGYYDVKTLSCLLCVLAVVGALRRVGLFPLLAQRLVQTFHTTRGAVTALVSITLVGSMLLTNDTALLTFLPLSWFVLERTGQTKWTALTFILQNCAANLGGMLTPFGNPQNLYLFNHYSIPNGEFLSIMLPPFLLSTVLILLCCLFLPRESLTVPRQEALPDKRRTAIYAALFCVAVAMVLRGILRPEGRWRSAPVRLRRSESARQLPPPGLLPSAGKAQDSKKDPPRHAAHLRHPRSQGRSCPRNSSKSPRSCQLFHHRQRLHTP